MFNKNNDTIDSTNVGNKFNIQFASMGQYINKSFLGSILGILLFILYSNYISKVFINSIDTQFILHADDTSISIINANDSKINNNLKILSN